MEQDIIQKIKSFVNNPGIDDKDLLFQLKRLLLDSEAQEITIMESKDISELYEENIKKIYENDKTDWLFPSGFSGLDKETGGLSLGELVVIGGRPSMGKTQLLVNLALNISLHHPVLFFSYDLSEYSLTNRFAATLSDIESHRILQKRLISVETSKLLSLEESFKKRKLFINTSCSNLMPSFKAICEKHIKENGVKVIFIDYLQMMSYYKFRKSRENELSEISRDLKGISRDFNVCIIVSSQLNRNSELRSGDKRPQLSDLRDSGAIEQDADKVLFIHRPEYYGFIEDSEGISTKNMTELIIAKNRMGRTGEVKLKITEGFTSFQDYNEDGFASEFTFIYSRKSDLDMPF
jgi:replicative DNA helicase